LSGVGILGSGSCESAIELEKNPWFKGEIYDFILKARRCSFGAVAQRLPVCADVLNNDDANSAGPVDDPVDYEHHNPAGPAGDVRRSGNANQRCFDDDNRG